MYEYRAHLINIVDGDTLHVLVDLGLDVGVRQTIRLEGINAPEMSTEQGRTAKQFVTDWFAQHAPDGVFTLLTVKDRREKFGRYLGTVLASTGSAALNEELIGAGLAVRYP